MIRSRPERERPPDDSHESRRHSSCLPSAARTNVNHALVYRYVGTKDELLAAVLEREAGFLASVVDACDGADAAARALFDAIFERGDFVTMLTRTTLSGHSATRQCEGGPVQASRRRETCD